MVIATLMNRQQYHWSARTVFQRTAMSSVRRRQSCSSKCFLFLYPGNGKCPEKGLTWQYQPPHYQNYNSIEMSTFCVHILLFWPSGMCNWETVPCSSLHQIRNVLKKLFKWSQSDYKKNFGDERNVGIVSVCW